MAQLRQLATALPERYTMPLAHLARVRLLTGAYLDRLLYAEDTTAETTARVRRRALGRLRDAGLVATLDRRIGGVRAGSAGHIYTLTSTGYRFLALQDSRQPTPAGRHLHAPGAAFLSHALAISDIYVRLVEQSGDGSWRVAQFQAEPFTWWPVGDGTHLRPDAYTMLAASTHRDCWWLEIDNNTESLPRIRRKIRAYHQFFIHAGTGPDKVPPRVLFTAPDQSRASKIDREVTHMAADLDDLMTAVAHEDAADYLVTELRK